MAKPFTHDGLGHFKEERFEHDGLGHFRHTGYRKEERFERTDDRLRAKVARLEGELAERAQVYDDHIVAEKTRNAALAAALEEAEALAVDHAHGGICSQCDDWAARLADITGCLLYTSPSPRDRQRSRMPSSA